MHFAGPLNSWRLGEDGRGVGRGARVERSGRGAWNSRRTMAESSDISTPHAPRPTPRLSRPRLTSRTSYSAGMSDVTLNPRRMGMDRRMASNRGRSSARPRVPRMSTASPVTRRRSRWARSPTWRADLGFEVGFNVLRPTFFDQGVGRGAVGDDEFHAVVDLADPRRLLRGSKGDHRFVHRRDLAGERRHTVAHLHPDRAARLRRLGGDRPVDPLSHRVDAIRHDRSTNGWRRDHHRSRGSRRRRCIHGDGWRRGRVGERGLDVGVRVIGGRRAWP